MPYSKTSFKLTEGQRFEGPLPAAIEAAMQITLDHTPEASGFSVDADAGTVRFDLKDGSTMDLTIKTVGSLTSVLLGRRELARIQAQWEA